MTWLVPEKDCHKKYFMGCILRANNFTMGHAGSLSGTTEEGNCSYLIPLSHRELRNTNSILIPW